jgi:hypothetical protein
MRTSSRLFTAVVIASIAACGVEERCLNQLCQDGAGGEGGTGSTGVVTATSGSGGGGMSSTGGVGGAGGDMPSTASAGGGNGATCGGKIGGECALNEYCDYPDDLCGAADGSGFCKPRPIGCPKFFQPTCACDGQVYGNGCDANSAGLDISNLGGCPPPPESFGCGARFCDLKTQYCRRTPAQQPETPESFECFALPASCDTSPGCACTNAVPCGSKCELSPEGGRIITCG